MGYIAYLYKDRKSDFGVSFPDFPGCVTAGKTLEEARRMASEALAFHIKGMAEDGDAIPKPSTIDDIAGDPAMKQAVVFLVTVDLENASYDSSLKAPAEMETESIAESPTIT